MNSHATLGEGSTGLGVICVPVYERLHVVLCGNFMIGTWCVAQVPKTSRVQPVFHWGLGYRYHCLVFLIRASVKLIDSRAILEMDIGLYGDYILGPTTVEI